MFLSRLILNTANRAVQRDLADCHALHRTVMSAFPDVPDSQDVRARLGVVYRVEALPRSGRTVLLVQSKVRPDWSRLEPGYLLAAEPGLENPACKSVEEHYRSLRSGTCLVFRLRANPTRKIDTKSAADGSRRNGRRVPLRSEAAMLDWLRRKGEEHGFELLSVRRSPIVPDVCATPRGKQTGRRISRDGGQASRSSTQLTFESVIFDGRLRVTDAERFRSALENGIGPGKAFGFGLLSVAPL